MLEMAQVYVSLALMAWNPSATAWAEKLFEIEPEVAQEQDVAGSSSGSGHPLGIEHGRAGQDVVILLG